jgi:hypothetical protein
LMRDDRMRSYRVDIESDSTIRADLTRNQQNMSMFLQGTAQFAQAVGPIVMEFPQMMPAVMEVYSAFARNFRLGKQAEDALDAVADQAKTQAAMPQKPNPKMMEAQAQIAQIQAQSQADQQTHAAKMQYLTQDYQNMMASHAIRMRELGVKAQSTEQQAQADAQTHANEMANNQHSANLDAQMTGIEHVLGVHEAMTKHELAMQAAAKKAQNGQKAN